MNKYGTISEPKVIADLSGMAVPEDDRDAQVVASACDVLQAAGILLEPTPERAWQLLVRGDGLADITALDRVYACLVAAADLSKHHGGLSLRWRFSGLALTSAALIQAKRQWQEEREPPIFELIDIIVCKDPHEPVLGVPGFRTHGLGYLVGSEIELWPPDEPSRRTGLKLVARLAREMLKAKSDAAFTSRDHPFDQGMVLDYHKHAEGRCGGGPVIEIIVRAR